MLIILLLFLLLIIYYRNVVEGYTSAKVYLVGDSIFNNIPYVPQGQDVFSYIKKKNPRAVMVAVDNSTVDDVYSQLDKINVTSNDKVFLSIGGNDILNGTPITELMNKYRDVLSSIKNGQIVLCDIYYPPQMKHYYPIIKQWNTFIHSFSKRYDIKKISVSMNIDEYFTHVIEPSAMGSVVIADTICSGGLCN